MNCVLCHTVLVEESASTISPMHRECALRNVMGGIGHLLAHYYFCRATKDPDAGLDYRTSALMVDIYVARKGIDAPNFPMREIPDELLPHDWQNKPVDRPLVDDLAGVLASTVVGWEGVIGADLSEAPEVKRVLARYRAEVMP